MRRTVDGGLTAQLFEHFGGTGESVTRFADGDVEDELLDAEFFHRVGGLVLVARDLDVLAIGLLGRVLAFCLWGKVLMSAIHPGFLGIVFEMRASS